MQAQAAAGGGGGGAPGAKAAQAGFKVQCVGLVKSDGAAGGANPVLDVLRGMCSRYETFERVEYGFSGPLQSGTNAATLRLFWHKPPKATGANPFVPPPATMWTLVHESTPMRGPVYAALPATVREAAESNIYADDARAFVEGLGARPEYAVCKRGNYYICHHQGLEIQVVVYSVAAIQPDKKSINLTGKHWMLEATADAAAERQVEVAKLMGSFAERLLPHVELKKPM